MWHRRESDESGESAPEEGGEGLRGPQPIPRSASYPCAAPRPGAPETTALQGGFQRRYGGITGTQWAYRRTQPSGKGGSFGPSWERKFKGTRPRRLTPSYPHLPSPPQPQTAPEPFSSFLFIVILRVHILVSLDPGTVPRAPSHFSRLPLGGWAEDGQSASRHPEPVPEEGSEDELPPQVHKVRSPGPKNNCEK